MIVDVHRLIQFFDDPPEDVSAHAAAVKAIFGEDIAFAVLKRYFVADGARAQVLSDNCKNPGRHGCRLDGWLLVTRQRARLLYQVEVKMWSATSLGGVRVPIALEERQLRLFRREEWKGYWSGHRFRLPRLNKLLQKMTPPEGFGTTRQLPLACLWSPMHKSGTPEPFFKVPLKRHGFREVHVFSLSTYLRSLRSRRLRLELPNAEARIDWLAKILPGAFP